MAVKLALARELKQLAELLLTVTVAASRDISAVDDDHDDVIMLIALPKLTHQLVGQAASHGGLPDAHTAVE